MLWVYLPNLAMGLSASGSAAVLTLREAVAAWLRSQASVTAIAGGRIYFAQPSQRQAYPCLMLKVGSRTYGYNLAGADGTSQATVTITALGCYESQAVALVEAIRNFSQGFRGVQSGLAILACYLDDEGDDESPPSDGTKTIGYQVPVNYRIAHAYRLPPSVTQAPA